MPSKRAIVITLCLSVYKKIAVRASNHLGYSLVPIRSLTAPSLSVVKNDVAGATSSEPEIQKQINLRNVTCRRREGLLLNSSVTYLFLT
jgi:hypothetical protein